MDAREFAGKVNYVGQERCARKLLLAEGVPAEDLAIMTDLSVYEKLLEMYEPVAFEGEDISLIRKEDMPAFNKMVRYLSR